MNVLKAARVPADDPCPRVEGRDRIRSEFAGYLADESRTAAEPPEVLFLPERLPHVCQAVRECAQNDFPLTAAGARTGIVGGAVPVESRAVLAMERMNRFLEVRASERGGGFAARLEAGVILADFQEKLRATTPQELPWADAESREAGMRMLEKSARRGRSHRRLHRRSHLFYPIDPTETSAQIGGTISTNASGARTFHYGPTRAWVEGLTVVLATGEALFLKRGEVLAEGGRFVLQAAAGETAIPIPRLPMPATKNTAGYYLQPGMDAVDLFIGSEGTLGVVTEVELRLTLEPPERLAATAFLPGEREALALARALRKERGLGTLAIEYFGPHALDLLRRKRSEEGASSGVPALDEGAACAVFAEIAFEGDEEFESCYRTLRGLLERFGTSARATWAGVTAGEMAAMKDFRHALPEAVNAIIARRKLDVPSLHKVGTDMAVPDERLEEVMALYRGKLAESGLEHVIFGHVGDNHLHVNILPRSAAELKRAEGLYESFARAVVAMGGSVSAEHGIGRIKRPFLRIQYGAEMIDAMRAVKRALDPQGLLNPGVIF
ncbi:MAG: FAD-binding oxidoreductase [Candidatus Brocadiia bacterium]|nr:FAD-binding oxidoreductase [Candidatus Brocadiia bacterium]